MQVESRRNGDRVPRLSGLMGRDDGVLIKRYHEELQQSGLFDKIRQAKKDFERSISGGTSRGYPYGFGGMPLKIAVRLYGAVRELRPSVLVETGVCNGVSTAMILGALNRNGAGMLYSVDLPEFTDTMYPEGVFWPGKRGAAVPKNKEPGWLIPGELRDRWELTLGRSQVSLPSLLERLGCIDFFLHDSEHSYECMSLEYEAAWQHLKKGGLLVSDDVLWNSAFEDFSRRNSREVGYLSRNLAFLVK